MQSSKLKSAVCMQPWSHSNLISRCGTARVPHKHNCLLGTMISNEMRPHHHCNLSGKISTRQWAPVPGVLSHIGNSTNSPLLSPHLCLSPETSLPNALFCPYTLFFTQGAVSPRPPPPEYLMMDRSIDTGANENSFQNGLVVFHRPWLFSYSFRSLSLWFLKWKSVLQAGDGSLLVGMLSEIAEISEDGVKRVLSVLEYVV